jgi:hypothetical protein
MAISKALSGNGGYRLDRACLDAIQRAIGVIDDQLVEISTLVSCLIFRCGVETPFPLGYRDPCAQSQLNRVFGLQLRFH